MSIATTRNSPKRPKPTIRRSRLSASLSASNWTAYYYRGIAYERTQQWDKAEADFRRALQLEPDQPMVLNYLGYSMIDKKINLNEAMAMVRKAVELKPNDGYIVDSLGWAHFQLGEYEEAVKQLERAVELKPADPDDRRSPGRCLLAHRAQARGALPVAACQGQQARARGPRTHREEAEAKASPTMRR